MADLRVVDWSSAGKDPEAAARPHQGKQRSPTPGPSSEPAAAVSNKSADSGQELSNGSSYGASPSSGSKRTNKRKLGRPIAYKGDPTRDTRLTTEEKRLILRRTANRESAKRARDKRASELESLHAELKSLQDESTILRDSMAKSLVDKRRAEVRLAGMHDSLQAAQRNEASLVKELAVLRAQIVQQWIPAAAVMLPPGCLMTPEGGVRHSEPRPSSLPIHRLFNPSSSAATAEQQRWPAGSSQGGSTRPSGAAVG